MFAIQKKKNKLMPLIYLLQIYLEFISSIFQIKDIKLWFKISNKIYPIDNISTITILSIIASNFGSTRANKKISAIIHKKQ